MFLWSKEHFREKFCKEISTIILNSTLFTISWLDVLNLLLIRGGAGVGFENWAEWAWLRAGRRAGIHWYAGKVKSLARKIYTSFAVIVRRLPHTTSDIWLWGQAPNRTHREGVAYIWLEPCPYFQAVTTPMQQYQRPFSFFNQRIPPFYVA